MKQFLIEAVCNVNQFSDCILDRLVFYFHFYRRWVNLLFDKSSRDSFCGHFDILQ